jgi:transcriptional regulator, tetR family
MTDLTPRREATVGRLVRAAITQFAARGIDATSVEHLCEAAGFSRGAFYSNFASKDDLCIAVAERYRDDVRANLTEAVRALPTGEDITLVAGAALDSFLKVLSPSREMTIALLEIRMRALRSPKLAAHLERINAENRPALVEFVEWLAKCLDISFILPTEHILDLFEALYYYELNRYGKYSIRPLLAPLALSLIRPEDDD